MMQHDFVQAVLELREKNLPRPERLAAVKQLVDTYTCPAEGAPTGKAVELLADAILAEELNDRHPDKVTREEYPFFSGAQFIRRYRKEASLWFAESYSVDGHNCRSHHRRMRSRHEHEWMDRGIAAKDVSRKERYRRNTAPGRPMEYNLLATKGKLTPEFVQCRLVRAFWERWSDAT